MRRKPRRVTQSDFWAAGRAFANDVAVGMAKIEARDRREAEAADREARREHLRAMGFDIPDEGSLAALAKLRDNGGSD